VDLKIETGFASLLIREDLCKTCAD